MSRQDDLRVLRLIQAELDRRDPLKQLPYDPNPKQEFFHRTEQRGSDEPVLFGGAMGGGKSVAICGDAIMECRVVPGNRVLMARKELVTFKRSTMATLEEFLPQDALHRASMQKFIFPNGSELHYSGLGSQRDLEKLKSTEWGAIYIDEASEVEYDTFLMAAARLRWKAAARVERLKMRLTSNPEPGWLKEQFIDSPPDGYLYIPALPTDNPHLAKGYIESLEKLYGDQPMWRKAYIEGDWDAFVGSDFVFPRPLVMQAVNADLPAEAPVVWGVDVARFGDDKTVVVIREGARVTQIKQWGKKDTAETSDILIGMYRTASKKPIRIFVDDSGVGGGVTDQLKKAKLPVTGLNVGAPSNEPEKFANLKGEIHWNFRTELERGRVCIPAALPHHQLLITELTAQKYLFQNGKISIEKKDQLKVRLRRSPDHADALILAFAPLGVEYYVPSVPAAPKRSEEETIVLNPVDPEELRRREMTAHRLHALTNHFRR